VFSGVICRAASAASRAAAAVPAAAPRPMDEDEQGEDRKEVENCAQHVYLKKQQVKRVQRVVVRRETGDQIASTNAPAAAVAAGAAAAAAGAAGVALRCGCGCEGRFLDRDLGAGKRPENGCHGRGRLRKFGGQLGD